MTTKEIYRMEGSHGFDSRGVWNQTVRMESVTCSLVPGHQRAGRRLTSLSVDFKKPFVGEDFLWSSYSECLVREDAVTCLTELKLTGFFTQKAEVTVAGRPVPIRYDEFSVTGWGGIAAPASGVELKNNCPVCGMLDYTGVRNWRNLIDWKQWDGSDIFMVWPLPRFIFVTARVRNVLESARLSGISFHAISELEPQEGGLSPGRLSYWLPIDSAKQYGVPPDLL